VTDQKLRRNAAAEYLATKYGYAGGYQGLSNLAYTGKGPEMQYVGRHPYYDVSTLEHWYENRRFGPPVTSPPARERPRREKRVRQAGDTDAADVTEKAA
jgi:hypothetical protein